MVKDCQVLVNNFFFKSENLGWGNSQAESAPLKHDELARPLLMNPCIYWIITRPSVAGAVLL